MKPKDTFQRRLWNENSTIKILYWWKSQSEQAEQLVKMGWDLYTWIQKIMQKSKLDVDPRRDDDASLMSS